MKKRQIKSFDGSFPSEKSLSFLILAHVLRHTTTKHLLTNNVCCYSTNRVHRRPQGHQGSGTNALFFSLSFSGKDLSLFQSARARFSLNSLFPYPTLKDTKITREKKRDRSETMETSLSRAREREIRVYAYRMKNSARASSFFLTQSAFARSFDREDIL